MNRLSAGFAESMASWSKAHPYLVAILAPACIVLLRLLVVDRLIGSKHPILLFLVAVIVAAWIGGLKPGLLATAISSFTLLYFYFPSEELDSESSSDWTRVLMFVIVSLVVSGCFELMKRAQRSKDSLIAALRVSEDRFRLLSSQAPVGIFQTDSVGNCLYVNECWCDLAGIPADEALGRGWLKALDPRDRERVASLWDDSARSGRNFSAEYRFVTPAGKVSWLQSSARPIHDADGHILGYLGTVTDITARNEFEQSLKDADRRKDEFLATLAHELRNPLAPMSYALELWRLEQPEGGPLDYVRKVINQQLQQMTRLIEDLLDVSRITRGKIQLQMQPLDVRALVNRSIEAIRPFVETCGHKLTVSLPDEPVLVSGDEARLTQVLGNLLHNASKYTGRNGALSVSVVSQDGRASIKVRDNGPGIPADMLTSIFEMFRQVDNTLTRSQGGLGIGLTLARQLVELHGGTIQARSEGAGRGSEFEIRLPCLAAAPDAAGRQALTEAHPLPRRRVLIVDDTQAAADTFGMMLNAMGQETQVALSGPAALELASEQHPDAIFLDIAMPEMDGYEVARRIRANADLAGTVLVAVTGFGQQEDRRRAFAAGFTHHLVKPAKLDALEAILMSLPEREMSSTPLA
ncbi:MAG TPA: ATP-binding protein [Pirellulales bacterium]|jgi:two-component system CheB/CheR fusion protein|nr:ATP-binding protein [Pirellulales bacterium]